MSGAPSCRHSRRARPNVPAVRGWVTASGGKGQAVRSMPTVSVHNGGIPSLATIASGNARDRRSSGSVGGFGLVEELDDDETAGVGRPHLAQPGFVGDALARAEIGDRGRAAEALRQPLRREERRADRRRSRP